MKKNIFLGSRANRVSIAAHLDDDESVDYNVDSFETKNFPRLLFLPNNIDLVIEYYYIDASLVCNATKTYGRSYESVCFLSFRLTFPM